MNDRPTGSWMQWKLAKMQTPMKEASLTTFSASLLFLIGFSFMYSFFQLIFKGFYKVISIFIEKDKDNEEDKKLRLIDNI